MDIDRIQQLNKKIQEASDYIVQLREEKKSLSSRFADYEQRISDLESQLQTFEDQQKLIEESIETALHHLDILEDHVHPSSDEESDLTLLKSEENDDPAPTLEEAPTAENIDPFSNQEPSFWESTETEDENSSSDNDDENIDDIFSDNPKDT